MSYNRDRIRKERKKLRNKEHNILENKIKQGLIPRFFLAKQEMGDNSLERNAKLLKKGFSTRLKQKLTWRQLSTKKVLLG